jgi:hypothetical protein
VDPIYYKTLDVGRGQYGVELLLNNVKERDFGLYTCVASNHLGKDYRSAFLIRDRAVKSHNDGKIT